MAEAGTRPLLIENQRKIVEERFKDLETKYSELRTIPHRLDTTNGSLENGIVYFLGNDNERIDLIIMGTGGAHGMKEFFGGTRTADVIDKSNVPVLVIPRNLQFRRPKKIALAYDYNGIANQSTLDVLKTFAHIYNAEFHIFNIAENARGYRDNDLRSIETFDKEFGKVHYDTRAGNDIEKEIENYVMLNAIDILAIIPREHGFFERLFRETTTEKLAYHTLVPLLVLRS
jgi:nucleotide-binding universal stress UspA family protein